jgi:glycosyltransferase involved in cell wall biosynthesis
MRVLLIEPYFGGSHRAWAEGYRDHSEHDVTLITLPARWWRWRMRGGAVTIAERAAELAGDGYRPDVVLVSSMIDVGLLRSLLDRIWERVPTALYMHESQLTYPDSPQLQPDVSYGFINWTSVLAADQVFFNSEYHRTVFFDEVRRMLRGFPDHRHDHLVDDCRERAGVLPVGIDVEWIDGHTPVDHERRPLVMWNHRWEHDKAPGVFFDAVRHLILGGIDFSLAVCGESFRQVPDEFLAAACDLGDRMIQYGHAPLDRYRTLLRMSDVVVSTARQEFFGISVMEAVAAGAWPVLPRRLSYPELMPADLHPQMLYDGDEIGDLLQSTVSATPRSDRLADHARRFGWIHVAPTYDEALAQHVDS